MIRTTIRFLRQLRSYQMMTNSLARGAAGAAARRLNPKDPRTWEFSGFSQNGEDGLIDVLSHELTAPNRYFVEIGASDGLENNTTWLAMVRRYGGIWVEGDETSAAWAEYLFRKLNYGVEFLPQFVTLDNLEVVVKKMLWRDPDVLSVDVDGNDFHVVAALLSAGVRAKVWVVEFNAAFGPERSVSIPYNPAFHVASRGATSLLYGCSIAGWRRLFSRHGDRFVTVEQNGVNAFFADPGCFAPSFLDEVQGVSFAENFSQLRQYGTWREQSAVIAGGPLVEVR